jgi:hypothetical protein
MKSIKIEHYFLGIIITIILGSIVFLQVQKRTLIASGKLITVRIINRLPSGKGMNNAVYECEFLLDGKVKRNTSTTEIENNKDFYVGKFYPALFLENTNALKVLITPEDFEEFGLKYPDSLLSKVTDISN